MRASVSYLLAGDLIALVGFGMWSVPLALVLAGVQLAVFGLLRPEEEPARHRRAVARRPARRMREVLRRAVLWLIRPVEWRSS